MVGKNVVAASFILTQRREDIYERLQIGEKGMIVTARLSDFEMSPTIARQSCKKRNGLKIPKLP